MRVFVGEEFKEPLYSPLILLTLEGCVISPHG